MSKNVKKLTDVAQRVLLQKRLHNKNTTKRISCELMNLGVSDFVFLDLETSVSLWDKLAHSGLAHKSRSSFSTNEFTGRVSESLPLISKFLSQYGSLYGFAFTYFWRNTGAMIIDIKSFQSNFNEQLFLLEDEITFVCPDFKKAIIIEGDRSGSGELLNYLSVSVAGDLREAWKSFT